MLREVEDGRMCQTEERGEIINQLDALEKQMSLLNEAIGMLEKRLPPVLAPAKPIEGKAGDAPPEPIISDVANRIRGTIRAADRFYWRVNSLLERLEV